MSLIPPKSAPTSHRMSVPISKGVDARGLAAALRRRVEGEVRFSDGDRHLYSTDASNYRQLPIGIVLPKTIDDILLTHELCREFGAPITNRGGGTSLAGQACNVAVILDTSKYLREIVAFDPGERTIACQPGIVFDTLFDYTQQEAGLTWGPDPTTHNRCTIGGMIGNNACGIHSFAYGRTEDNVEAMEVLLYDGTRMWVGRTSQDELETMIRSGGRRGGIYGRLRGLRDRYAGHIRERFPDIPRRVSGYNLPQLLPEHGFNVARALVGTEGTCVTVLQAKLNLNRYYPQRVLLVLGYPDVFQAGDHVAEIRRQSKAIALEGIDQMLIRQAQERGLYPDSIGLLPEGRGWLLLEFGADTRGEADEQARELMQLLRESDTPPTMRLYDDPKEEAVVWEAREAGLGATAHTSQGEGWPGWEDSAVHPARIGDYLRDLKALFHEHGLDAAMYGHFGDGCVHCRINFDLISADGVRTYRKFLEAAADLVSSYNGSYSGEHGDGQQRAELLGKMFGPEIVQAFREFKAIWDPDNKMNPGKVVDPYKVDDNLRLGSNYRPWEPEVKFSYPHDGGSFERAALLCVGIGKCRRDDGHGVMCPSYMVTREEMHSTRGRARLLFEMLRPDSQLDGWRDEHVKEALELCLSCKGCTIECPVNVDMPTYKAEFFYHHYKRRLHPPAHYALGLINVWSRLASIIPGITNGVLRAPRLSTLLKKAAGIAPQRPAPIYAGQTFRDWFDQRPVHNVDRPRVLLFPDTFTNYYHPAVGKATVTVLEDAGYQVTLSPLFCCGRPLYDYGFLDLAQRYLDRLIDMVRSDVSAGVKIVGMEPSCTAVFRDELVKMKPHDVDAQRIAAATMTLSEFLTHEAEYRFPPLERSAIVQSHCHHKGAMGMDAEFEALDQLGLDWEELDAGCCGLAGSFGFEAGDKYDVSVACGERKLLPAVREASDNTFIIANGFSCRTQIAHLQDRRRALHLAEVIAMAKEWGPVGPPVGRRAEEGAVFEDAPPPFTRNDWIAAGAAAGAAASLAGGAWWKRRFGG